jgi:hypothetical protein
MAIFDYLSILDTYGVSFNIYIKSKKTYNTYLTLIFSLITYALFFIILYIQEEDFLYKINPNISYMKQDDLKPADFTSIDKFFFPVLFEFYISSEKFKGKDIFPHLKKKLSLTIHTENNGLIKPDRIILLYLDDCLKDNNYLAEIESGAIIVLGNSYCVNGFNFQNLINYNFDKVDFVLNVAFDKCEPTDPSCLYNQEVNAAFNNGHVRVTMKLLSAKVDLHSYSKPFSHYSGQIQTGINEIGLATLYPIKIRNIGDDLFTKETQKTKLSLLSQLSKDKTDKPLFQFKVNYYATVDIYQRQYKTFSAGLASTLAVMKVVFLVFSFISKHYCKIKIQNMFINNNFDYMNSVHPIAKRSATVPEGETNVILVDESNNNNDRKKKSDFRLGMCEALGYKVKRCFCLRLSKKQQFYKASIDNILKTLSVENILKKLYEIQKLKYLLLTYEENLLMSSTKTVIDSERVEGVISENKALQFNNFSIIEGYS